MRPLLLDGPPPRWLWPVCAGVALILVVLAFAVPGEGGPARGALALLAAAAPFLTAVDLRERRLPDLITLPLAAGCALILLVTAALGGEWSRAGLAALCALGATAFFLVLFVLAPSQMGFGDVKLMLSFGLVLGWQGPFVTIAGVMLGLVSALVFGLVAMALRRAGRRSHLALGPHLIAGALVLALLTA
jgi:leader peptidase (prepilin peptidase)/N-methyltransferase